MFFQIAVYVNYNRELRSRSRKLKYFWIDISYFSTKPQTKFQVPIESVLSISLPKSNKNWGSRIVLMCSSSLS